MSPEFFITVLFLLVSLSSLLYFYSENRRLKKRHFRKEMSLIEQFTLCDKQLKKRQRGINKYDFLKFNISEALIIQPEIKIL